MAPANANLLVFAGGNIDTGTAVAGTGFTAIQSNVGSITEQNTATITGNNVLQRATAGLSACCATGNWLMQMAIFRDASWTVGGGWNPPRFAAILDATQFPGSDIGAQINNAYAALPANGGHIIVPATPDGSCRNITSATNAISFTTPGKYPLLECAGGSGSNGPGLSPTMEGCLNYMPNMGTALTLDYAVGGVGPGSGSAKASGHGVRNCTLINAQCQSQGGCGGTAIGIDFGTGTVNQGAQSGTMENVSVVGFSTGVRNVNFYSAPMTWINPQIWDNGVGFDVGSVSTTQIFGGFFDSNGASNGTGAALRADSSVCNSTVNKGCFEFHFFGTTFVANPSWVVDASGNTSNPAIWDCISCHLENGSGASQKPHYIQGNVDVLMVGGTAEDDVGSTQCVNEGSDYWFNAQGSKFTVQGTAFNIAACNPMVGIIQDNTSTRVLMQGFNMNPAHLTNIVGGTGSAKATVWMQNGNTGSPASPYVFEAPIVSPSVTLVYSCGNTTSCSNTAQLEPPVLLKGVVALTSGTPSTATITGISVFSVTSYNCTLTDITTASNNGTLKYNVVDKTSFTITGANTSTDTISYLCVGS